MLQSLYTLFIITMISSQFCIAAVSTLQNNWRFAAISFLCAVTNIFVFYPTK